MQIALLIFIVIISLAIGFFGGLLINSMDKAEESNAGENEKETQEYESELIQKASPDTSTPPAEIPEIEKPSAGAQLVLKVWKEKGQPPIYQYLDKYVPKDQLPEHILHMITIQKEIKPSPASPKPVPIQESPPIEAEIPETEVELLSVIGEIEKILQEKLESSDLLDKGIHLMENHNREIRIWVGLNSYDSVDDIPDADIRQIINSAVQEWEERNS
jgi:hypothetical protein